MMSSSLTSKLFLFLDNCVILKFTPSLPFSKLRETMSPFDAVVLSIVLPNLLKLKWALLFDTSSRWRV